MSIILFLRKHVLTCIVFTFLVALSLIIPLNYDEVWNYVHVSSKPFVTIITYYDYPNNHIFHSLLVRLFGITSLYARHPNAIRLVSCITTIILWEIICRIVHIQRPWKKFFVFLGFISFSPQILLFSVYSRGYMLGTVLLFLSIMYLQKKKVARSVLFAILSVYTVPTFLYAFPGLWVYLLYKKEIREAITHAFLTFVGISFVYLPILNKLILHTNAKWNDVSYGIFLKDTFHDFLFFPPTLVIFVMSLLVLLPIITKKLRIPSKTTQKKLLPVFLSISIVSYLGTICLLYYSKGTNPPFVRNGVFLVVFLFILCLFLAKHHRLFCYAFFLCVCGNIILSTQYVLPMLLSRRTFTLEYDKIITSYLSEYSHIPYGLHIENIGNRCCFGVNRYIFLKSERNSVTTSALFEKIREKLIINIGAWIISTKAINPELFLYVFLRESDKNYTLYAQQMLNTQSAIDNSIIFKAEHYMTLISDGLNYYQTNKSIPDTLLTSIYRSIELHGKVIRKLQQTSERDITDLNILSVQYELNKNIIYETLTVIQPHE